MNWQNSKGAFEKGEGFYAIHYSYDNREGSFITVLYIDNELSTYGLGKILDTAGPFKTEPEASKFVQENDITW